MAGWKFPAEFDGTLEYIYSTDYEDYIQAFGRDWPAAEAALIRLLESPMLVGVPEDRAHLLHSLAQVLVCIGNHDAAIKRLREADVTSPGSPFWKFYEGSFFARWLDRPGRGLEIAKEALELLGSPHAARTSEV